MFPSSQSVLPLFSENLSVLVLNFLVSVLLPKFLYFIAHFIESRCIVYESLPNICSTVCDAIYLFACVNFYVLFFLFVAREFLCHPVFSGQGNFVFFGDFLLLLVFNCLRLSIPVINSNFPRCFFGDK